MFNIGWFSTGRDQAAIDLLDTALKTIEFAEIPDSKICWVFCNRAFGEKNASDKFIRFVKKKNLPLVFCSSKMFLPRVRKGGLNLWRYIFDRVTLWALKDFERPDVVVFAGYMLIVSPELCNAFPIINLHPALPGGPKGSWQKVTREIVRQKAPETGAMMHLVTPELDAGPPVTFCRVPIEEPELNFKQVRAKQLKREFPLIVQTLKGLAQGKFKIEEFKDDSPPRPVDLTEQVEKFLGGDD